MPEPPRSRTDEWSRVISQARGQRPRRLSDELELLRVGKQWRSIPITAGLLVVLLGGYAFVVRSTKESDAEDRQHIQSLIDAHDVSSNAHQGIRAEVRREWASVNKQLGELRARVTKLSEKTTRRRR